MRDSITFKGAVLREQGVTFAIVRVTQDVLDGPDVEGVRGSFAHLFHGLPVILMALDRRGKSNFHDRRDIARFLSTVRSGTIDWIDCRLA